MNVFDAVAADLRGREAVGNANHGGRALDPMEPGRDWLREAYEECLDLAVYLRAELARARVGEPKARNAANDAARALGKYLTGDTGGEA